MFASLQRGKTFITEKHSLGKHIHRDRKFLTATRSSRQLSNNNEIMAEISEIHNAKQAKDETIKMYGH